MMSGRVTSAMTRNRPPQSGQIDRSIASVRTANGILIAMQSAVIGAVGAAGLTRLIGEVCVH